MDPAAFQVLDKAVAGGGTGLAGGSIAGKGKSANQLLEQLVQAGLLEKANKKFHVTPAGRSAWEQHAPPERREQVRAQEEQQKQQALGEFLNLVEKKAGKPLTATEWTKVANLAQEACDRKLVEPADKVHAYRLLAAGRVLRLAELPVERQVADLRQTVGGLADRWSAVHQRLRQELPGAVTDGAARSTLEEAAGRLRTQVEQAGAAYESALAELQAFAHLLGAARQLQQSVLGTIGPALQKVEEKSARLRETEERVRQALEGQRAELEGFRRLIDERLDALSRQPAAATC